MACCSPLFHIFWPHSEVAELVPFFIPFLAAVFNLAISSLERPHAAPQPPVKSFTRKVNAWHALDGFSILLLMLFEASTAVVLSVKEIGWMGLGITVPLFFLPYALILLAARWFLLDAYTILAQQALAGSELEPLAA